MTKRMRRQPGGTNPQSLAMALEQFDQGRIAEWLLSPFALATNEKDIATLGICRTLIHDILAHRCKRFWLQEINDSLCPGFGSNSFGVLITRADRDPLASVRNIFELEI